MAAHRPPPRGTAPESASETPDCQTRVNSLKYILSKKQKTPLSARGHWSTWPAFGCGQTILGNHKPCCAPEERESSNKQALLTIPKPQYLEELESYLKKELQSLDLTEKNAQELKLQAYREIFEFFIDSFKTYKPLLSAIKNEYEVTLAHQKKTIRSLEPLKAMVTTVSEECTQRILALQEKQKDEIYLLKQEKQQLLKIIDNMKEEKSSLQTQVEYLQASVAEEYTRYLNQHDAHKLLLAKLNEMHHERLDMTRRQAQDVKGEDGVKLTLALKVARQDLTKAQVKLNKMLADYGDVVPRRDFESLEKKYSDLLQEMNILRKDFDRLHEEYETLLEIHRETEQERDNFCAELQRVQQNCTPRPNWEKCSDVIPGGAERWDNLAVGKTSEQLVDVLLEEIGTAALKEINVFPGWGKNDNVPVYLRHEGEVKNKKLTKKDVVNILKDIWKEKIALEQQTGKRSSLPKFFLSYLQKKFGDTAAMEWSYTLYENMRLCPSNHVLSSFYNILTGKVSEEQYHSQNELISSLQKELAACDGLNSGSLTSEEFSTALGETFPLKRKESIQELVDASRCKLDSTEDTINYISLFEEDEEGNTTPFVAKLRSQYIREKQEYLRQLKNKLGGLTEVNADDLKAAFCSIDPDIDDQMLETYLGLALQARGEGAVAVETALKRLLAGDVRRVGPAAREGSTASSEGE
ncbi:PREDICTED: translin-associated factor X-interacting protein 1 isoform X1 [Calidris pugnax]|uniref:translin-associated factor X-interacting protein 1 isoform X1 n=1 Tax=Calidris pugnax TaxID=198806 RepID=UPI00071C5CA9|nr:PREDICTED: translin-associated factor X-interacting protein 1 isoform X1 [Calidris pugnax]